MGVYSCHVTTTLDDTNKPPGLCNRITCSPQYHQCTLVNNPLYRWSHCITLLPHQYLPATQVIPHVSFELYKVKVTQWGRTSFTYWHLQMIGENREMYVNAHICTRGRHGDPHLGYVYPDDRNSWHWHEYVISRLFFHVSIFTTSLCSSVSIDMSLISSGTQTTSSVV